MRFNKHWFIAGRVDGPYDRLRVSVKSHGSRVRLVSLHSVRHYMDLWTDVGDDVCCPHLAVVSNA